jgi:hypothetical protein
MVGTQRSTTMGEALRGEQRIPFWIGRCWCRPNENIMEKSVVEAAVILAPNSDSPSHLSLPVHSLADETEHGRVGNGGGGSARVVEASRLVK